jgi:RimJ/RimL family protein N-acetyltransferase
MSSIDLNSVSTARLRGERMSADHFSHIQRMHDNERFMAHLGGIRSNPATVSYIARNVAHWDKYGFGIWILRDRQTSQVVGRGGLRHIEIDRVDEVEIGYAFFPERWGQGLATELAIACIGIARDRLGLDSVVAIALPHNEASRRVMVKVGFEYERDVTLNDAPVVLYRRVFQHAHISLVGP